MVSNTAFEQAVLDALASMKTDIASMKTDIASMKTDIASIKRDVATLNVRVGKLEHEAFVHYTSVTKDLQQLRRDVKFLAMTTDTRLSALEAQVGEIGRAVLTHEDRFTAIEARL